MNDGFRKRPAHTARFTILSIGHLESEDFVAPTTFITTRQPNWELILLNACCRTLRWQKLAGDHEWSERATMKKPSATPIISTRRYLPLTARRDVELIVDHVDQISQDERGFIKELELRKRGRHPVDFVIDCTGFRSLILGKILKEPFIPLDTHLLNDRAIPLQLPHRNPKNIEVSTGATALSSGWVWRVPLFSRLGTGYVYSSAFTSDEDARSEFLQHLRSIGDLANEMPDPETRVIKMRVGHARRTWVKNCVAIGLSGGFVEPLEATGIFFIDVAARWFVGHFPDKECHPALAERYNLLMNGLFEEVRDFIQLHYLTSNRPEPYWMAARREVKTSESLASNLELWKHRMPEAVDTRTNVLFTYWNFIYVLAQKDYFKDRKFPLEGSISRDHWRQYRQSVNKEIDTLTHALPAHYDLVNAIRTKPSAHPALLMNRA